MPRILMALIAAALIAAGPAAFLAPDRAGEAFGVAASTREARVYLLATATRDLALGIWLLSLVVLRVDRRVLAASAFALAVVAAGDVVNVATYSAGRNPSALVVHVAGFSLLAVLGVVLWRRNR